MYVGMNTRTYVHSSFIMVGEDNNLILGILNVHYHTSLMRRNARQHNITRQKSGRPSSSSRRITSRQGSMLVLI